MLMGAMVMGPAAGLIIKKFDKAVDSRIPAGFEMPVNNFSPGIIGMILAIIGYYLIGPVMSAILTVLSAGVAVLVAHGILPLVSIFIEPAKVLFLNNAINHGIFSPIGAEQAAEACKSIMYMLEINPGPGLGVLLAYWVFSKDKITKTSAPGAIIIHLFGGIHEIYFPYILMNPAVIIAPIVGNAVAILFFSITGAGLVGPPSLGSIIVFLAMTPKGSTIISILGVAIAAGVSFLIASPIIKMTGAKNLEAATNQMQEMKTKSKGISSPTAGSIRKIIFACDAGMGSSAVGATKFHNRIKSLNTGISVSNTSVDNMPSDANVVVCQVALQERARACAPQAQLVTIENFLSDPNLDALYNQVAQQKNGAPAANEAPEEPKAAIVSNLMVKNGIVLGLPSVSKEDAIRAAGEKLIALGCVDSSYVEAMLDREKLVTTYMGLGVAIPHGTTAAKSAVKKSGIVCLQYPQCVQFGDEKAYLVFGIAGAGDKHIDLLSGVSNVLEDEELLEKLKTTTDKSFVLDAFQ